MKSVTFQSLAALAAFLLSSEVAAMPKAQLAPPPPPPPAAPVCGFDSAVGGADPNDLGSVDLGDNGQCYATGPAGACARLSCAGTSGVYMCNNVDDPAPVGCDVAEGNAQNIRNICPDDSGVLGYQDLHEGYRLYIAYGNCNCPSDRSPYDQVNC